METPSKKPRRKENWSTGEIEALRNGYFEFSSTIEGKLTPSLTGAAKERTWKEISERYLNKNISMTGQPLTEIVLFMCNVKKCVHYLLQYKYL